MCFYCSGMYVIERALSAPDFVVAVPVNMGSWGSLVGDAFNALISGSMGRRASVQKPSARRELGWSEGARVSPSSSKVLVSAVAVDTDSLVQGTGVSLCTRSVFQCRRHYSLAQQQDLGSSACAFRDSFFEERGHTQGWMTAFLKKTFEFEDLASVAARAAYQQIKCAVRTAQNGVEKYRNTKGKQSLFWRRHVVSSLRRRRKGRSHPYLPSPRRRAVELVRRSFASSPW